MVEPVPREMAQPRGNTHLLVARMLLDNCTGALVPAHCGVDLRRRRRTPLVFRAGNRPAVGPTSGSVPLKPLPTNGFRDIFSTWSGYTRRIEPTVSYQLCMPTNGAGCTGNIALML